jgi:hypothetical protein
MRSYIMILYSRFGFGVRAGARGYVFLIRKSCQVLEHQHKGKKLIRRVGADGYKYGRKHLYTPCTREPSATSIHTTKGLIGLVQLAPKQIDESFYYNAILQHDGAVGYSLLWS